MAGNATQQTAPRVLMSGVVLGESPRWHAGRLWFSDWGAQKIIAIDPAGRVEDSVGMDTFPFCLGFLPGGDMIVIARDGRLLRRDQNGALVQVAALSGLSTHPWNDIVIDSRGNAYVNNIGFEFPGGDFAPGIVALVTAGGTVRQVAAGVAFPNGMAVTPDGSTLILAESYAECLTAFDIVGDGDLVNRRTWAAVPGDHPDGICIDAEGAVWYADVGNQRCVRVRERGEVLATVELDRGAFACALSRGEDPRLFVVGQIYRGPGSPQPSGQVVAFPAPAPGAGRP
jgi:sugar lactone lactonase YvrE